MTHKLIFVLVGFICIAQHTAGASDTIEAAKTEFESDARQETEAFLNSIFKAQMEFFTKVRAALPQKSQRSADIQKYITRLEQLIEKPGIIEKDEMWRDIFLEANKSPLVLNNESETGLTNLEYAEVLQNCGLKDMVQNSLADVAAYFWKMAKASGKVMEVTVGDYVSRYRKP